MKREGGAIVAVCGIGLGGKDWAFFRKQLHCLFFVRLISSTGAATPSMTTTGSISPNIKVIPGPQEGNPALRLGHPTIKAFLNGIPLFSARILAIGSEGEGLPDLTCVGALWAGTAPSISVLFQRDTFHPPTTFIQRKSGAEGPTGGLPEALSRLQSSSSLAI